MNKGTRALLIVVFTTAVVMTPLILGGVLLGYTLGDQAGISKSILAIAFSTVGFVIGMFVIFKVIEAVAGEPDVPSR